jgi:hypothetical protein
MSDPNLYPIVGYLNLNWPSPPKSPSVVNRFSISAAEVAEFTSTHTFQLATLLQSTSMEIQNSHEALIAGRNCSPGSA